MRGTEWMNRIIMIIGPSHLHPTIRHLELQDSPVVRVFRPRNLPFQRTTPRSLMRTIALEDRLSGAAFIETRLAFADKYVVVCLRRRLRETLRERI